MNRSLELGRSLTSAAVCVLLTALSVIAQELPPKTLYYLAESYVKKGQPEEAIDVLRKLFELEPAHVYGNHALGIVYAQTGNKVGAMQQYHTLQNLSPDLAKDLLRQIPQ